MLFAICFSFRLPGAPDMVPLGSPSFQSRRNRPRLPACSETPISARLPLGPASSSATHRNLDDPPTRGGSLAGYRPAEPGGESPTAEVALLSPQRLPLWHKVKPQLKLKVTLLRNYGSTISSLKLSAVHVVFGARLCEVILCGDGGVSDRGRPTTYTVK